MPTDLVSGFGDCGWSIQKQNERKSMAAYLLAISEIGDLADTSCGRSLRETAGIPEGHGIRKKLRFEG
jgi:hypothetical protein